ncbi:hypothetical protein LNP17_09900 [Klebsiella variicola subsp. variicola]|nr:hypothetical protein [Klebsiella variicola subsp. variicola]
MGPTAVISSVGKLPTGAILGGVLLNQKLNPSTLENESDKQKLMVLLHLLRGAQRLAYPVQHRVTRHAAGGEETP